MTNEPDRIFIKGYDVAPIRGCLTCAIVLLALLALLLTGAVLCATIAP